jgi:hypothetical protein
MNEHLPPLCYAVEKILSAKEKDLDWFKLSTGVHLVISVDGSEVRRALHTRFLAHCRFLSDILSGIVRGNGPSMCDIHLKPKYPALFSENIESLITWSELVDGKERVKFVLGLRDRGVEWMKGMYNLVNLLGIRSDDFNVVNKVQNSV